MPWQTRSSRTVYANPWIEVREDDVVRPDGSPGIYGVVELRRPAVFVVPLTDDDEVVLVEVDRYTVGGLSRSRPGAPTGRTCWSRRLASCARRPG